MIYLISNRIVNSIQNISFEEMLTAVRDFDILACDTETTGYDPHTCELLTIQIGTPQDQYVIDVSFTSTSNLFKMFDQHKAFIFHNAAFDLRFLIKHNIEVAEVHDTFLAECIITNGYDNRKLSLQDVVKNYTGNQLDKSVRSRIHIEGLSDRVIHYAAEDVAYLHQVLDKQQSKLEKQDSVEVYNLERRSVKVFAKMQYDGVHVDSRKIKEAAHYVDLQHSQIKTQLDTVVSRLPQLKKFTHGAQLDIFGNVGRNSSINWNSTSQKAEILSALGIDVDSTSERDLFKVRKNHEIIPLMMDYSKKQKFKSAFGSSMLKFINKRTGRIHPQIWQILKTGRISVREPNLNQIPSKGEFGSLIRSCFTASPGYKIVGGDYSGMELRILAEVSQDPLWLEILNSGGDLHSHLCSKTFNIDVSQVRDPFPLRPQYSYRDVQKTISFGLAYGMTEHKLADILDIEVKEAKQIIDSFFNVIPVVKRALDILAQLGLQRGYSKTLTYGRRRHYSFDYKQRSNVQRAAKNMPIQGTNADIIKAALCNVYQYISDHNLDVRIILAVYDEIQTEAHESIALQWAKDLKQIMIDSAYLETVPVEVDIKVSDFWSK